MPFGLAVLFASVPAPAADPPAPLRCLARFYALVPELRDDTWVARLPDGRVLDYDDGRAKTFDERLDAPDLEDMVSIPYRTGAIRPITGENDDPGRIRADPLFAATYGAPPEARDLVVVSLAGRRLRVHRKVVPFVQRVGRRLDRALAADPGLARFLRRPGGGFSWREVAGTDRRSPHGYGIAIDLDPRVCQYWRWQRGEGRPRWENRVPQAIVDAFEAEGFIWGGRWYHYDTMHFEYRPELLDPACYPVVERPPG